MPIINSLEDLKSVRQEARRRQEEETRPAKARLRVSMGSCSIAAGARDTLSSLQAIIESQNLSGIKVSITGCIGLCEKEPLLEVQVEDQDKIIYGNVTSKVAQRIVREHILGGEVLQEYVVTP
jgi:NADP-reducing hydrogenase subunit HndB